MTCARYRALISRYLDDELTARQRTELLDHLTVCASCSADLARLRQGEVLLRKLPEPPPPPPALGNSVQREVRAIRQRRRRDPRWWLAGGGRLPARTALLGWTVLLLLPLAVTMLPRLVPHPNETKLGFSAADTPTPFALEVPASPTRRNGLAPAPPRLLATRPYDGATGVDPHGDLLVSFDGPMDRRSVEHAFRLAPPAPGHFQWEADNQVRFQPSAAGLLRGVTYTVALTDGARSLAGAPLPSTTAWAFQTRAAPALQAALPAPGTSAPITAPLVLTFTQPLDPAALRVQIADCGRRTAMEVQCALDAADTETTDVTASVRWIAPNVVQATLPNLAYAAIHNPQAISRTVWVSGRGRSGDPLPLTAWTFTGGAAAVVRVTGPRLRTVGSGGAGTPLAYRVDLDPQAGGSGSLRFTLYSLPHDRLTGAPAAWLRADAGDHPPGASAAAATGLRVVRSWTAPSRRRGEGDEGTGHFNTTIPPLAGGLYLLTADLPDGAGDALVLAAGSGVVAWLEDGRPHAWAGLAPGGGPVQVTFYDAAGGVIQTLPTDAQGLAAPADPAPTPAPKGGEENTDVALVVAAADDGGMALARLGSLGTGNDTLDATVLLDSARPAPGDLVQFSVLVRPPVAGGPLAVTLRDAADRTFGSLSLQPDQTGLIHGSFPLAAGAAPGSYRLEVRLGNRRATQPLTVVPRPVAARLDLDLRVPPGPLYAGDTLLVTVRAANGALGAAAGLPVHLSLSANPEDAAPGRVFTATTDAEGVATVPLRLPDPKQNADGITPPLWLHAIATDTAGRSGQTWAALAVQAGRAELRLTLPAGGFAPGSLLPITGTVRDAAGQPWPDQAVTIGLWAAAPGADPPTPAARLSMVTAISAAGGVATATLALPQQGAFRLYATVTDPLGTVVTATAGLWVYAAGAAAPWAMYPGPLPVPTLTADRATVQPGDTVRLLVAAGEPGTGLLWTRLGGRLLTAQPLPVPAGGTVVNVPVPADATGSAPLEIGFGRFAGGGWQTTGVRLPVQPPADRQLDLILPSAPDGSYAPGSALPLRLALAGARRAVSGEALLRLTAPDGSGAVWLPALPLDGSGALTTTLTLPATPGFWQLDAWAFTAGSVIHSATPLRTLAPLTVRWAAPAQLVAGDHPTVPVAVTNNSGATVNVSLQLAPSGVGLQSDGGAAAGFPLTPGETRRVSWPLRAVAPGAAGLTLDVAWGLPGAPGGTVQQEQAVTIAPYGLRDTQSHAGLVSDSETVDLTLPGDVDPATAQLEIHAAPTLAGALADALTGLPAPAPSDPVTLVAARLEATAAVEALYRSQGRNPDDLPPDRATTRAADLQTLYSAQSTAGGWGAWAGAAPDLPTTSAALRALWAVGHAGDTAVDTPSVERGLRWLAAAVNRLDTLAGDTAPSYPARPFAGDTAPSYATAQSVPAGQSAIRDPQSAIEILSRWGRADGEVLDRVLAVEPSLAAPARAALALALRASGRGDEARLVVERLVGVAAGSADPVVLDALLAGDPAGAQGPVVGVARRLLATRNGAAWATPAESAAALVALSHYAGTVAETAPAGPYRIIVNGQSREVPAGPGVAGGGSSTMLVPGSRLHTGDNSVRFETSSGRIYYSLRVQALVAGSEHPILSRRAAGVALGLRRSYAVSPAGGPLTVALTLTLGSPLTGAQLTDPLPAGLVRLPGATLIRLPDVGTAGSAAPVAVDLSSALYVAPPDPDHPSLDAQFGALPAGTYVLTYAAAPQVPGLYTALPARLTGPTADLWVQSGSDSVTSGP